MSFVKLDSGILQSTLWIDRDARDVFITALLMAEPQEFPEGAEQLHVERIELTGWKAPPGWYGFVPAAGPGIVRNALVDKTQGMEALGRLGEPDPESRSQDFGGRRLVRINGGYLVLNFFTYRDRDYTSATRSKRYRERKKEKAQDVPTSPNQSPVSPVTPRVTRDESVTRTRDITHAEAEAEAEEDHIRARGAPGRVPREAPLGLIGRIRAAYPEGTYRSFNWLQAERAIAERLDQGITDVELEEAAAAYCRQQVAKGSLRTQYVLSPDKFYAGSVGPWQGPFTIPKPQEVLDPRKQQERTRLEESEAREWGQLRTRGQEVGFRLPVDGESLGAYRTLLQRHEAAMYDEAKRSTNGPASMASLLPARTTA